MALEEMKADCFSIHKTIKHKILTYNLNLMKLSLFLENI